MGRPLIGRRVPRVAKIKRKGGGRGNWSIGPRNGKQSVEVEDQ